MSDKGLSRAMIPSADLVSLAQCRNQDIHQINMTDTGFTAMLPDLTVVPRLDLVVEIEATAEVEWFYAIADSVAEADLLTSDKWYPVQANARHVITMARPEGKIFAKLKDSPTGTEPLSMLCSGFIQPAQVVPTTP